MAAQRFGAQLGELDAQFVGEVGDKRPLRARIMHCRNASTLGAPPGGEQFDGVAEFGEIGDVHRAGRGAERLPCRMLTCQGTRVCGHHGLPVRRTADSENHHGHALLRGAQQ